MIFYEYHTRRRFFIFMLLSMCYEHSFVQRAFLMPHISGAGKVGARGRTGQISTIFANKYHLQMANSLEFLIKIVYNGQDAAALSRSTFFPSYLEREKRTNVLDCIIIHFFDFVKCIFKKHRKIFAILYFCIFGEGGN